MDSYVWIYQDLDSGATHAFDTSHIAMHNAERAVGNRAFTSVSGEECMMLYGRGDGSTSIMIRRFTRKEARQMWPELNIPEA